MDTKYWLKKWKNNDIGFHESQANALMTDHINALSLPPGSRVFLPLCGKTRDIAWLLANGYQVVGAELIEEAILQLFKELDIHPEITSAGALTHYRADRIDIYVGDIFSLSGGLLGRVDAVYDRAALVALPAGIRSQYASHLMSITGCAPQLLISFEYDQKQMEGPPFSVGFDEIAQHYSAGYDLTQAAVAQVPGGLKGQCAASENAWLLMPKRQRC